MAAAALPSTRREMALMPATSTTEGIMMMSLEADIRAVLPLATVETISLGRPIGRRSHRGRDQAVPPLPPIPITPRTRPA